MSNIYKCVQLTSNANYHDLINDFKIDRESKYSSIKDKIVGLEAYLKRCAWQDDLNGEVKIYLILDESVREVAAYFGLKAGMVASSKEEMPSLELQRAIYKEEGIKLLPEVLPGVEISHFAVNDNYRRRVGGDGAPIRGLGEYFYPEFIYPIISDVASKIGVNMIYLYAAGDEHLVSYYERVFGFQALDTGDFFVPLEPDYDGGCVFMYQLM